jgi:hypothetical protein
MIVENALEDGSLTIRLLGNIEQLFDQRRRDLTNNP